MVHYIIRLEPQGENESFRYRVPFAGAKENSGL